MYLLPYGEGAGLVSGSRPGADWRESDNVACMVASPPPSHHVTQTGKLSYGGVLNSLPVVQGRGCPNWRGQSETVVMGHL